MRADTILIVDDDPICAAVASHALKMAGFKTQSAGDGMEALDLLETLQPDLILSDIQMPNMDGFELARRTRQIPRLRGIPMIALTAITRPDTEQRAFEAGFNGYLTKPVNATFLAIRIRRFLESGFSPQA